MSHARGAREIMASMNVMLGFLWDACDYMPRNIVQNGREAHNVLIRNVGACCTPCPSITSVLNRIMLHMVVAGGSSTWWLVGGSSSTW
jgi:hypothetical protein